MAALNIPHLTYIRQIPIIGKYIYEALQGIQEGVTTMAVQGNLDPNNDPAPPPNIQAVTVTGQNGFLHVSIQDQSEGLSRGTGYVVEHADNRSFINAQQRFIGASRGFTEFIGNDTRFVRAYSTTDASANSAHVYHGSASSPTPVSGGGTVGPPAYLPSQGAGTGAPGQAGLGQGPVQTRSRDNSFDWSLQSASGRSAGFQSTVAPVQGLGGASSGTGSDGGVTLSESAIAPCEWLASVAGTNTITASTAVHYQALSAGFVVRLVAANTNSGAVTLNVNSIGATAVTKNGTAALVGGELVAGQEYLLGYDGTQWQIVGLMASMIHGDFTVAASGNGTLATVNPDVGTSGDSTHTLTVTVNAKGLITSISVNAITFPAPTMAQILSALGYTPATSGANSTFSLTAPLGGGAVTGTITQV